MQHGVTPTDMNGKQVRIDPDLVKKLRLESERTGIPVRRLLSDILKDYLKKRKAK